MSRPPAGTSRFSVFVTILSFAAAVALLTGIVVTAANYLQTRSATANIAADTLDRLVQHSSGQVTSFFGASTSLADVFGANPRVLGGGRDVDRLLPSIFRGLARSPQVAGLYAGYDNGDFWEVFAFPESDAALVAQLGGPPATRFGLQTIWAEGQGPRTEHWRFFDQAGTEVGAKTNPSPAYDPRTRVWYQEARAKPDHQFIRTPPYVFNAGARAGLTIAVAFDAAMSGVVASDVTLADLSKFLASVRPGPDHRIAIFTQAGQLLATPNPKDVLSDKPAAVTEAADPVIRAVAAQFTRAGAFGMQRITVDGEEYLASVVRLDEPDLGGEADYILNAAPRSEFEGTLAGSAERSILLGLAVVILSLPLIIYIARVVSKPIVDLSNNAKLIEAILNTVPSPVFYKDPEARYIGCNEAFETTFKTKRAEVLGKRLTDLVHLPEQDRLTHQEDQQQIMRNGVTVRRELTLPMIDGRIRETLYHATPFHNADGSLGGLVGTLVDITQMKETQHALAEAKEVAEAATKAKGEFLASMSHEIRTPLNGVTGMADLLAQTSLDDDQRHMLSTIRESGDALLRVINDILDFSKIEAGKLAIESISMSIADALEGVAITLTPAARAKDISIHTFADPKIPVAVMGDPGRVRQILFNLLGNAVKFSNKRDVALRAVNLGDGRVRFEAVDQGIGISVENQGKLFQAFSQAESSTTRRYGGTGLGLAICKRLTDLMDGVIGVTSELGKGSTFFVELPFASAEARAQETARDLHGLAVLLVGSPAPRAEAMSAYLAHWGARLVQTEDEGSALDACRQEGAAFNAVIADLDLDAPRQRAFIDLLRSVPGHKAPVVALQDFRGRGARIKDPDVVTVDANPLVRYRFITAVAVAAGRASPEVKVEEDEGPAPATRAPTVDEARAQGRLILLVEDNPTNQDVIRRQLQRLGYACEIAGNGRLALEAWRGARYALILTDCHMPEMDGYELTGAIRSEEKASGTRQPIIAVTANALQGEADRCVAAGMDDYLSKPINMKALRDMLRKWMPAAPVLGPEPEDAAPAPAAAAGPIDPAMIKGMFGDDDVLFKEILGSFVEPSADIIKTMAAARAARDAESARGGAHQLKSSARTIGANDLADTCLALETAAKAEDWAAIDRLTPVAEQQMAQVISYIKAL